VSGLLQEGAIFAGHYRVVRRIASGGMGSVYEVVHLETERRRALKVMHPHILQSDEMRARFKLEAKVAAHIESDFIVDVFDAGVDEATEMPFLVMELLRGEELNQRVKRLGRLLPEEVVSYLHQTAQALDETHQASIVHRDLKPENLFLAERKGSPPRIKVLDFGIAKIVAEGTTKGAVTTQSLGTPLYMAPEQFNPSTKLSPATDIYALGMIAYTLLVGVTYWFAEAQAGNIFAFAAVAVHGPPEPASVRAAAREVALPPAFDRWFATATALHPVHRFPTASAAVRALAEVFGIPLHRMGSFPSDRELSSSPGGSPSGTREGAPPRSALASDPDPAALPASGPAATSLGASMTQPLARPRSKGAFVAVGFAFSALALGGGVVYALHARRAPAEALPAEALTEDKAQAAPPAAEAKAPAPPLISPAAALSVPEPPALAESAASVMASASSKPPSSSAADGQKRLPPQQGDKPAPIKPAKGSNARSAPASSAPTLADLKKKYRPD
jgi:serine/threonine-protein kinase